MPTFTPDMRAEVVQLDGALRYSYQVSPTVWKDANGVWHSQENPYDGDLADAELIVTRMGPVDVSEELATELTEAGIGTIS